MIRRLIIGLAAGIAVTCALWSHAPETSTLSDLETRLGCAVVAGIATTVVVIMLAP